MPMVEDWLNGLGLGKYAEAFAANDVDRRALPHLDTADLQELGVSPGHRKIMLAAIAELRGSGPEVIKAEQRALAVDGVSEPRDAEATGEPGPDVRLLSVLFCDMVGSTGLSSRFSAEEMHDLIGSYHQTVASAVTRFGGYVAKFLGDGVLVYFGWPMAYEDHAERAIRAESMLGPVPKTLVATGSPNGPPPSKEVAQIASVIGREFDRSLLAEIVMLSGPVLDGALRRQRSPHGAQRNPGQDSQIARLPALRCASTPASPRNTHSDAARCAASM